MDVKKVYESYEQDKTPQSGVRTGDGTIQYVQSTSQRGDCVVAEHLKENIYKAIRIIPEYQSKKSSIQDHIKNPTKPISEDFNYCSYQLMITKIPDYRRSDKFRANSIHKYCEWNSRKATRKRTAMSSQRIQKAWDSYR